MITFERMNGIRIGVAWRFAAAILVLGCFVAGAAAQNEPQSTLNEHWVTTWATAQQLVPQPPLPGPGPHVPATLKNQTVRMVARTSIGGRRVRIEVSNAIGSKPLVIGNAHIALRDKAAAIIPKSDRALTFGGRPTMTVPPGALIVSDPVDLAVPKLTDLAISLYLPEDTGTPSIHPIGLHTNYIAEGEVTAKTSLDTPTTTTTYLWLSSVDVLAPANAGVIVAFGDSITDGFATTIDKDQAWPTLLARRLATTKSTEMLGVLNLGIAGNRVLRDGAGLSAVARFDRDVLSRSGVRWMTLLEGINDITFSALPIFSSEAVIAEDLIGGYRQIIERAHMHGIKVAGATIMPVEGVSTYRESGEAVRQAVNQWIRTSRAFDAVIDFDALMRDPADPKRLRPEFDPGDHVHPDDKGNERMAEAIDLSIFLK
jgi:lysophospholipase L1-like esterase